jgi:hypothetical protein
MPTITAQGKTFVCDRGANLREVLVEQGGDLYNGEARLINCWGMDVWITKFDGLWGQGNQTVWTPEG